VDVWWVDPEGGSPQRLTDDPAEERWPAFSPNGDWLAFVSVEDATETVHLMNLSTGQRQLVAGSTSSDPLEHPAWLDDGRLLYAARLSSHEIGLFLVDSGEALPLEAEGLPEEAVILGWSSAGGRVVLTVGLPGQHSDLFTATVSSEGRLILDEALAVGFEPKLSPDGQRLAFRAPPYSDDPAGYLLEFSSDEVSSYDEPAALRRWDHDLTWSSDGSHYAFVRSSWAWTGPDGRPYYVGDIREPIAVGGEEGIYAGGPTEPTARQITDVGYDVGPALSPDGGLLAFTANRDDYDRNDIWLLDLSTGEAQALVRGGGSCWGPIWRP
jgi:Tol biopolymer transport system component